MTLRLGTRGSQLATTQSGQVAAAVTAATGVPVELVIIKTRGDQVADRPLQAVGGKGLFTKEIEDALLAGEVDFAVHSLKDMPTESPPGLILGATPRRVDPRDALIGARLADLPPGAVVGTGSVRRTLQLRELRPDLEIKGIRGNVDTRIEKQRRGEYAAVMLAVAGLTRLARAGDVAEALSVDQMVPAVGQGALAVQCREDADQVRAILQRIHDEDTAVCVELERAFLEEVSGGCSAPAACHARLVGGELVADGVWGPTDVGPLHRLRRTGSRADARAIGVELARRLKAS
jgi:hydroxymethylbilane synthase